MSLADDQEPESHSTWWKDTKRLASWPLALAASGAPGSLETPGALLPSLALSAPHQRHHFNHQGPVPHELKCCVIT